MKKNFVKVMFFGALALSTVTYVGCKDYDDDVKNLQEQIDKINAKEPGVSTEAMNSAIQSAIASLKTQLETAISGKADNASVQALQTKVNELVSALEGKADASKITELVAQISELSTEVNNVKGSLDETKANLEAKIASLEEQIAKLKEEVGNTGGGETPEDTSLRDQLNKLTADLATTQNELAEVDKAAKDNAAAITELTVQITELNILKEKIEALEAAHENFVQTGDLAAYYTKEEIAGVIDTELASYMNEDQVASYVDEIVKTEVLTKITAINGRMDTFDADLSKVSQDFAAYRQDQTLAYNDVIDRITALEDYKGATLATLEETVKGQGEDLAKALLDIKALSDKFAGYATTQALSDVETRVKAYVDAEVKKCTDELATLKKTLEALQVDVDGLKNMIQSITFVPNSSLNRTVNIIKLYAKSKADDADYEKIQLDGAAIQEVMFRISPAAAAKSFVDNYEVTFSADKPLTRSAEDTELFEKDGEPVVKGGLVTYKIKSNASGTYAVCMHVSTKEDKVKELGKTDITSDYFVAEIGNRYLVDAYYKVDAVVEQELYYDDKEGKADYADKGRIVLSVSRSKTGDKPSEAELSDYPGIASNSLNPTFSVDNDTYFKVNGTAVILKAYETPSYIGQTTKVRAKVTANGFYTPATEKQIGVVTITRQKKEAAIDYGKIDVTWNNEAQTVEASKFPLNKIYDDENVRLTLSEFQALTGKVEEGSEALKAYFEIGSGNELTAVVEAQTPAGDYPVKAIFTSEGRTITVTAIITVQNPEIAELAVDKYLWGGTATAGKVVFTPTLDQVEKPSSITLSYDLSKLFANYSDVQEAVEGIAGATLKIDVPEWKNIAGITYNEKTTTLTFDKDKYTGLTLDADAKKAKVQIVATVSLAGTDTPLQKLTADVNINDISGSWENGKLEARLDKGKAAVYSLAEEFRWKDMRGKTMWENGSQVDDQVEFGTAEPLSIYGLKAPSFEFVDANGKKIDCPYLQVNEKGELSFTSIGKGYNFQSDYMVYVLIDVNSQWGDINGYKDKDGNKPKIAVTIPANLQ